MNPIQKYPHIIELPVCVLNMLYVIYMSKYVFVFLCPINILISLGTC